MEEKEITYQGKRISYKTAGEGMPVVLVHGFGEDSAVWKMQIDALSGFHLIVPDLPGSGRSELLPDMSIDVMADVLERLLVHELATVYFKPGEPGSVVMIGHSMGGYVTLAFAEKFPHMLRAFGLFHSTAFADSEEKKQTRWKGIDFIEKNGAAEFLKTMIPGLYAKESRDKNFDVIEAHIQQARNFSSASLVTYYKAMIGRPDRSHVLRETGLPVLFVLGKHDSAVPLEDGLKQAHMPRTSYIHILDKSGHMGMWEEHELSNDHLLKFLDYVINTT